jgi:SAM-dependent methyltransferase
MAERNATDFLNLRLPLYAYTAPLWASRRVLEIGCEDGESAVYLAAHGAAQVVVIDTDVARIDRARADFPHPRVDYRPAADLRQMGGPDGAFDLVIVPEGKSLIANRNLLAVLRRILSPSGHILISVPAADRRTPEFVDGLGYYELVDALDVEFEVVRMLGRTPFLGFGLVEFDSAADALRLDATLLRGETETPSHYIAIAGATQPPALGYALVQVPFAPVETGLARAASQPHRSLESEEAARRLAAVELERGQQATEIAQLKRQLDEARHASRGAPPFTPPGRGPTGALAAGATVLPPVAAGPALDATSAAARVELAERRLDESERRGRARLDEADGRLSELRRKLDEALVQSESAVRVSRIQGDEIEELRGRLRRVAEDRAASDAERALLRRALAEADESVLTLTRKTAEEMTAVAARIAVGLRSPPVDASGSRERQSGESSARDRAEISELADRLEVAEARARALDQRAERVAEHEARIARLELEKLDLVRQVGELGARLRQAPAVASEPAADAQGEAVIAARDRRDQALVEFHRLASAHAREVHRLQSSVDEQTALVVELEDALRIAEARVATADTDAAVLRRTAKALEDADRARRGRLAELEGKLLRFERERTAAGAGHGGSSGQAMGAGSADVEDPGPRLAAMEQRMLVAEQRAVGLEERLRAAEQRAAAAEKLAARPEVTGPAELEAVASDPPPPSRSTGSQNGSHAGQAPAEMQAAIEEVEQQLRHELRMLAAIEETLARARDEMTQSRAGDGAVDLQGALAAKDAQLIEGRLEMTRLRRDAEARQTHLEREVNDLRAKLHPFGQYDEDPSQSTQLILMHTTLANIRRRAARLRDELEGFRRRLDSIPPGALSSLLEEIGEDLSEFAK